MYLQYWRAIGFYIPGRKSRIHTQGSFETRNEWMVEAVLLFDSIPIFFGFLLLLFVPGFALSLAIFPRSTDLSITDRMVYSTILSISSGIASVVFMDIVLGLDRTLENFILIIGSFSVLVFLFWAGERYYLNSRFKKRPEMKTLKRRPGSSKI